MRLTFIVPCDRFVESASAMQSTNSFCNVDTHKFTKTYNDNIMEMFPSQDATQGEAP